MLAPMIQIGMSTSCVYPLETERAFQLAREAGFDGVEVMATNAATTRDAVELRKLSKKYHLPILSIHAPVLLLTTFVWGRDPQVKLERSAELAAAVGADTVVVHPPFRWQKDYSENFLEIVRRIETSSGINIGVENMFPWKAKGRSVAAYAPGWDPSDWDCDNVTLDFSHASLAGQSGLELAQHFGDRLRHIHLCDGSGSQDDGQIFDEHLIPGMGTQPVAETLEYLAAKNWDGAVVAEINTRRAKSDAERLKALRKTVRFARTHLGLHTR